eukprot:1517242-Rhodomonas_salina.1
MVQDHNLENADGTMPYVRPVSRGALDGLIGKLDSVMIGSGLKAGNASQFFDGDLGEVLLYDAALTNQDLDRVGSYLSGKYNLQWQVSTGPSVTALKPCNGPASGGFRVTLYGGGFSTESQRLRAQPRLKLTVLALQVNGNNATEIQGGTSVMTLTAPPGVGFAAIRVWSDEVQCLFDGLFQYDPPYVSQVMPSTIIFGDGSNEITIVGKNFGRITDGATAKVSASDGDSACAITTYFSDTSLLCTVPTKTLASGYLHVTVGSQISGKFGDQQRIVFKEVPDYYRCPLDDECGDCCRSRCELEALRKQTATGRTHQECNRQCYLYCGNMLQKAGPPTALQVVPAPSSGSKVHLTWHPPEETGGARILRYSISYTCEADMAQIVVTDNATTAFTISGLLANTVLASISVQAETRFGLGQPSEMIAVRTGLPTLPSAPMNVVVSKILRSIVEIGWAPPDDDGGAPALRHIIRYALNGQEKTVFVPGQSFSYTFTNLSREPAIEGITIVVENSAGVGAPSNPVTVTTIPSTPPTVSSLHDTMTVAGESSVPQSVQVFDSETAADELVILVKTSSEELTPQHGISIEGIGHLRFIVVTPAPGKTGESTIFLTVVDEDGLQATSSFVIVVTTAWQQLVPTRGSASGGTTVTITGAGFSSSGKDYACRFSSGTLIVDAPASFITAS